MLSPAAEAWVLRVRVAGRRLEQFELGHVRGESQDHSRIIRLSYHTPEYVELASGYAEFLAACDAPEFARVDLTPGRWEPWTPLGVFLVQHVLFASFPQKLFRHHADETKEQIEASVVGEIDEVELRSTSPGKSILGVLVREHAALFVDGFADTDDFAEGISDRHGKQCFRSVADLLIDFLEE